MEHLTTYITRPGNEQERQLRMKLFTEEFWSMHDHLLELKVVIKIIRERKINGCDKATAI